MSLQLSKGCMHQAEQCDTCKEYYGACEEFYEETKNIPPEFNYYAVDKEGNDIIKSKARYERARYRFLMGAPSLYQLININFMDRRNNEN